MISTLAVLGCAAPAHAQSEVEKGFAGALRGCEEWILNPASWAESYAPFQAKVGLGNKMGLVDRIADAALPPKQLRRANHYWRINSTQGAGYVLVVSDELAMCHITGGGDVDLQPVVESVLASQDFAARWEQVGDNSKNDMASTVYRNRQEASFSIVISRAKQAAQRLNRVQVLVTGTFDPNS